MKRETLKWQIILRTYCRYDNAPRDLHVPVTLVCDFVTLYNKQKIIAASKVKKFESERNPHEDLESKSGYLKPQKFNEYHEVDKD